MAAGTVSANAAKVAPSCTATVTLVPAECGRFAGGGPVHRAPETWFWSLREADAVASHQDRAPSSSMNTFPLGEVRRYSGCPPVRRTQVLESATQAP